MYIIQNLNNTSSRNAKKVSGPSQFLISSPHIYRPFCIFPEMFYLFQLYSVYILFNNNTNIEEDKKRYDLKIVFVCVSLILTSSGIKDRARQRSHFKEKLKIGSRDFTV